MTDKVYKNEYELTGFLANEHNIVEWDQSTIINNVYSYILENTKTQGYGRDMELVLIDSKLGERPEYTLRARHRETKKQSDSTIVVYIGRDDVYTEVKKD